MVSSERGKPEVRRHCTFGWLWAIAGAARAGGGAAAGGDLQEVASLHRESSGGQGLDGSPRSGGLRSSSGRPRSPPASGIGMSSSCLLDRGLVEHRMLADPVGHRLRPEDQHPDEQELQADPGDRAPVDVAALHLRRRDAAQVEEREAERRMHERGLDVDAEQQAEPDHVDVERVRRRQQQRHHDEADLEEVEEEREEEDEDHHEDQEPGAPARQRAQHVLDPAAAVHALEDQAEHRGADQDEDHHRGDPRGRSASPPRACGCCSGRAASPARCAPTAPIAPASVGVARPRKMVPSTRKISTSDGTMPQSTLAISAQPRSVRASGGSAGTRCGCRIETARMKSRKSADLQDRGADRAEVHVADRDAELVGEHDQHQRRRDHLGDGAGGGDHAGADPHVVAVLQHHRQRDHPHGDDRGGDRAGDGAEDRRRRGSPRRRARPAPDRRAGPCPRAGPRRGRCARAPRP